MTYSFLLATVLTAAPAQPLLSPTLLGASSERVAREISGCQTMRASPLSAQSCRVTLLGQPADVAFNFGPLGTVSSFAIVFPNWMEPDAATRFFEQLCAQLRRSFATTGQQHDAMAWRHTFATAKVGQAWADLMATNGSGSQVRLLIQMAPYSGERQPKMGLSLDGLDLRDQGR